MTRSAPTSEDAPTALIDPALLRAKHRVGSTLCEKWTLQRLLGVGGMAAVYRARHRNGKEVAIKILHRELSLDEGMRSRFLREGYAANKVGHPGALSVQDDNVAEDGSVFLVMDLLSGETVESRRERSGGKLDVGDVLAIADQLLDVLIAAHRQGIVHRDLKPENLFLCRDGTLRVLDFGIARVRELSGGSLATQSGMTMGTPSFMAPEQARGLWDEVDGRTDLWAVGATMFHLLTGRLVHDGRTANELLLSAMTKPAPPIGALAGDVRGVVAAIVDRALAYRRDDRFADAAAMQRAVREGYLALRGAPISTAAKLVVPVDVSDLPTLRASTGSGATAGRTNEPVSAGRASAAGARGSRIVAASVAAAVVLVAAGLGVRAMRGAAPDAVSPDASPGVVAAASVAPTTVAPPASASSSASPTPSTPTPDAATSTSASKKKGRPVPDAPTAKPKAGETKSVEELPAAPAPTRKAQGPMEQTL